MLIIRASYRARGPFARPKYDLALAIGAVNPSAGRQSESPGPYQTTIRSLHKQLFGQENASLRCQMYVSIALNSLSVQTDPPGFGSIVRSNARSAAAAPKTLTNKHNQARNHVTCFQ